MVVTPGTTCVGEENVVATATVTDDQEQFDWYIWQSSTDVGTNWTDLTSAAQESFSSSEYTVTYALPSPIPSSYGTRIFRINVATSSPNLGSANCSLLSSGEIIIGNTEISLNTTSADVCQNASVTITGTATGDVSGIMYQWQESPTLNGPYSDVSSGGTSNSYSVPTSSVIIPAKIGQ